jgi:hypothetical protein
LELRGVVAADEELASLLGATAMAATEGEALSRKRESTEQIITDSRRIADLVRRLDEHGEAALAAMKRCRGRSRLLLMGFGEPHLEGA